MRRKFIFIARIERCNQFEYVRTCEIVAIECSVSLPLRCMTAHDHSGNHFSQMCRRHNRVTHSNRFNLVSRQFDRQFLAFFHPIFSRRPNSSTVFRVRLLYFPAQSGTAAHFGWSRSNETKYKSADALHQTAKQNKTMRKKTTHFG